MKNIEKTNQVVILSVYPERSRGVAKYLGGWVAGFLFAGGLQAGEINFTVGGSNFVNDTISNGQSFEAFKFDLPEIPQGARIDFAGLVLYIDRPPVDLKDTLVSTQMALSLLPVTTDWTPSSLRNGQVVEVDKNWAAPTVADFLTGDRIDLDITYLVKDWIGGRKTNRGFILVPEFAEEKTDFSIKSSAGFKAEIFIYYTGPEVVKQE